MRLISTSLTGVLVIAPKVYSDERGFFFESFNVKHFAELTGIDTPFVQDNHSRSVRHVLRGLHYQIQQPQGKLVRVTLGEVLDVAVDIRKSSPTFGRSESVILSAENRLMRWIPPGFAHGFVARSEMAELMYKTTDYWAATYERSILWSDSALEIDWQLNGVTPVLAAKDQAGKLLKDAEVYA